MTKFIKKINQTETQFRDTLKKKFKKLYSNHEYLIEQFLINEEKKMPKNQKILDAGAGSCQYKKIFIKRHTYTSNDLCKSNKNCKYNNIDIISPIENIPLKSNSFDYIILTQVLEHVENPQVAINELSRLLKKNGKILCSTPLCYGEHEIPYNYFNFTQYGLKYIGKNANLKIISTKPMGGHFILTAHLLIRGSFILFGSNIFTRYLLLPYYLFVASAGLFLDRFDKDKTTTIGHITIFKKIK